MATPDISLTRKPFPNCPLVLVGMPGSGKSAIGRRLATRLGLPFIDSDAVIEADEGQTIAAIFADRGEPYFRAAERRTLAALVQGPPSIIATGGGAFMDPETRALIHGHAVSVWLRAPLNVLIERTRGNASRPLLKGANSAEDLGSILQSLLTAREPVYAEADIIIDSDHRSHESTLQRLIKALKGDTEQSNRA